jgi:hypothetical protein
MPGGDAPRAARSAIRVAHPFSRRGPVTRWLRVELSTARGRQVRVGSRPRLQSRVRHWVLRVVRTSLRSWLP